MTTTNFDAFDLLDELNAGVISIELIEKSLIEEAELFATAQRRKKRYALANYKNLFAAQIFHHTHDNRVAENALNFDLDICSKTLGKKLTFKLQEV